VLRPDKLVELLPQLPSGRVLQVTHESGSKVLVMHGARPGLGQTIQLMEHLDAAADVGKLIPAMPFSNGVSAAIADDTGALILSGGETNVQLIEKTVLQADGME
jgi:hypothetical protein